MFISDFAIKRPVVTVATMLAIAGFGAFALAGLKTDELPDVKFPVVGVTLVYPGASPEGVEREVLDPIEDRIAGISGVDKLESTVRDGVAQIAVYFDFDKDVQTGSQEVRDAIAEIRGDLPLEMEEPTIMHFDPADAPVMSLTLTSTSLDAARLTRVADPGRHSRAARRARCGPRDARRWTRARAHRRARAGGHARPERQRG